METLIGDIFIIPNPALYVWEKLFGGFMTKLDAVNVQVWISSEDCENWGSHAVQNGPMHIGYLPLEMLAGVKEGDVIEFEKNGYKYQLTAAQKKYRYKNFGTFEEVLKKITKSADWVVTTNKKYSDAELVTKFHEYVKKCFNG